MKKTTLAILLIVLLGTSGTAFARLESMEKAPPGRSYSDGTYFTTDIRSLDLQKQIDELTAKNSQLESKIFQLENKQPTTISVPQPTISTNDTNQTQRIDTLEKRMTLIEKTLQNVSGAISNTIDLIKKLLAKI